VTRKATSRESVPGDLWTDQSLAKPGVSLRAAVVGNLREAIVQRVLPPGAHLIEEEIALRLGVSRNPVREAFRSLEQEGWLSSFPGAGVFVAEPSADEVVDLLEVRGALESLAARLAAERASATHIARIQELLAEAGQPRSGGDMSRFVNLNSEFHLVITKASKNDELLRLLPAMSDRVRWLFAAVAGERVQQSWKEHAQIAKAIARHDSDEAARLATLHVVRTTAAFSAPQPKKGQRA
jgi:DNA-binding GntR family transcriptional regulator